jgi:L-2-hydroxycarboxylate dehydrogenase (NAD+)
VIDRKGLPATDSSTLIEEMNKGKAALLPLGGSGELMGGHKGYGLATMVEILSSAFQDGAFLSQLHDKDEAGNPHPSRVGHFFLAMNIESFLPLEHFKNTTGSILRELRAYSKAPGQENIYTAGEKAYNNEMRVMKEGVRVPPSIQRALNSLRTELNVSGHDLGF